MATILLSSSPPNGATCSAIRLRRSAPCQSLSTSRSWQNASALMQPEKRSSNRSKLPVCLPIWRTIASTTASTFLVRCESSRVVKARCSSYFLRSVMSREIAWMAFGFPSRSRESREFVSSVRTCPSRATTCIS